ncbi:hypothetical protein E4U59_002423 [Claviceps monticola]|nr:hypothetical protein E4U59_002423 [Claviceps monticola]
MSLSDLIVDDALLANATSYVRGNLHGQLRLLTRLRPHSARSPPGDHHPSPDPQHCPTHRSASALLHDVGDKKYLQPGQNPLRLVHEVLLSLGASEPLAQKVQAICSGVSYSSEIQDPEKVTRLIEEHPELAVVQDADRLDAIGAVGIGRAFAFGGAKGRDMRQTMEHFEEKFVKLGGMMKTVEGRRLAAERTERIEQMIGWWTLETEV